MDPPEIEVENDVMTYLLPRDYDRNETSDGEDEDTGTYTQHRLRVIHPEAMSPTVRNVYNLRPRKQTDYAKESIDKSMSLLKFGNDLNKDAL